MKYISLFMLYTVNIILRICINSLMYIVLMVSGSLLFMFIRLILFKQVPYELTAYANKEIEF